MAGRNLWHKPHFQPELESVNKNASSKDRYLWERKYNHHLLRMQAIQSRPVYRPKIIKREYYADEVRQLEEERAKHFYERTRLNTLPLASRQASPAVSRESSWHTKEINSVNVSPGISPRSSKVRPRSWPNSKHNLYVDQNFPTFRRSLKVSKHSPRRLDRASAPEVITDSETFFQHKVAELKQLFQ